MTEVETKKQATEGTATGLARFWLAEIDRAGKREKDWRDEGMSVVRRYRKETDKKKPAQKRGFNILWSNVELLKPAVLSRTPQPDVRRRFLDENPVGRVAAQILERALKFTADDPDYDFVATLEQGRDDMLLPGRGVVRIVYEVDRKRRELFKVEDEDEFGQPRTSFTLDGQTVEPDEFDDEGRAFREDITNQEVYCQYVYWEDYREGDARVWEQVPWVAYRHTMTRKELVEQFGDTGKKVPLPLGVKTEAGGADKDPDNPLKRAPVWEIWNRGEGERIWVAENFHERVLDTEDDPLGLENFFPQPEPLYAVKTTDTRVPVPEFRIYKDQADELDQISFRIDKLIKALKVRGLYAAILKEMANLLDGDENELFPVEDWPAVQERGGLDGLISWLPIEQIAKVLAGLYEQRDRLKQEIFELTGLSDIIRGSTDPRETKGAQQLKANFGTVRLTPRQQPMERFVRGLFMLKAEIMAEHFTADQLLTMTGMAEEVDPQVMPQIMQLLRDDKLRGFVIDIETDSTVQPDEQREQANVSEFMRVTTEFMVAATELTAANPALTPLMFEIYKAGSRRFKMGRELEDAIDEASQQTLQALQQAQQQQQADPEAEAMQAQIQRENEMAQSDVARKDATTQADIQRKDAVAVSDMARRDALAEQQAANGAG